MIQEMLWFEVLVKHYFWSKKFILQNNFGWVQKYLCLKKCCSKKIWGPKKCWSKQIFCQKNFWSQIFFEVPYISIPEIMGTDNRRILEDFWEYEKILADFYHYQMYYQYRYLDLSTADIDTCKDTKTNINK